MLNRESNSGMSSSFADLMTSMAVIFILLLCASLNNAQQDEFVRLFAELLEASYSDKIDRYARHVKVDYTGEIQDGEYVEVRTVVRKTNDRMPMNYRLINEAGTWKVYDVVFEGVSLISNYRSQFSRIIHESSYAELVQRLKTRVSELKRAG